MVTNDNDELAHDHMLLGASHDDNARRTRGVVALTTIAIVGEIVAGWLTGSMAGAVVIARWSWTLLRDTAAVLLDVTHDAIADEVRKLVEAPGDVRITDLHVWRIGPQAHAAIVGVTGASDGRSIRRRPDRKPGLEHLTVEVR